MIYSLKTTDYKLNLSRAKGCLVGQLAGDALGSLVEFKHPDEIKRMYPDGVRVMTDGGAWNTIAGQPTDDSEMALLLARMLIHHKTYNPELARNAYKYWLGSGPFDCGATIASGLTGQPKYDSQANGAMMRISPLGIFGANFKLDDVAKWAMQDAEITHPHTICQQTNALFAMGVAYAIQSDCENMELYQNVLQWAKGMSVHPDLLGIIQKASKEPPENYVYQQGWVLIAFQNTLYQLTHATSFEEGVVDTIMRGGDTDTNAAICGALLGAVYGQDSIPPQWIKTLQNCRPYENNPKVHNPRPECFWPVDVLELASGLIEKPITKPS